MDTKLKPTTPLSATTPFGAETVPLGESTTFSSPTASSAVATTTGTGMAMVGSPQKIYGGTSTAAAAAVLPKLDQTLFARFLRASNGRPVHSLGDSRFLRDGRSSRGPSDDTDLNKKICETHESDDLGVAVKPILHIMDVILYRSLADFPESDNVTEDEKVPFSVVSGLQDYVDIHIPCMIANAICYEIFVKFSVGVDVDTIVMDMLHAVKQYNWESKVVLALLAFAAIFSEFRTVLQLYPTNPLAKAVASFTQLPDIYEHAAALKPKLNALYSLIKEVIDVTKKIVEFRDIAKSPGTSADVNPIPIVVYWSVRSVVISTTQIITLTGMGIQYSMEIGELSYLAHKLKNMKRDLLNIIEKKTIEEGLELLVRTFATSHIDNSKPLGVLFKDDPQGTFYDCYNERRITIEDLRGKIIALFITEIDPELTCTKEYEILQIMHLQKQDSLTKSSRQYEVIWVPVTNIWNVEKYRLFEMLRNQIEWHSVHHPSVVSPVVLKFFREKWNFSDMPLLVVMDTQGRIVHNNALHMMCIWGSESYPFTTDREKSLWEGTSWTIDLLAGNLEPNMTTWINEGRYVCLYGGDDIEWIHKFTRIAKKVAQESGITLELLYVGKNNPQEAMIMSIIYLIRSESLSSTLVWNVVRHFWLRFESMWYSRRQFITNNENMKGDVIMQGIISMLSYGSCDKGFAVISHGYREMVMGNGLQMLEGLANHGRWRTSATEIGFVPALSKHLHKIHFNVRPRHCTKLFSQATGATPDTIICIECGNRTEVIERNKDEEAIERIVHTFTTPHKDNSKPLEVLFKDPQPFYDCYNKRRITIEELKRKVVALFITEINPQLTSVPELIILQNMYIEKKFNPRNSESQYEVIWVPVADVWTDDKYKWFENLRNEMEWLAVQQPSAVSREVLRFFREKWNFSKKPLLVVMDVQGRIVHNNAIHMMCIWGSQSYPFTSSREKLLWEETSWNIDLLVDYLEPAMFSWINEGRFICLYGGEDIEWIRKFTRIAKDVARESGITLELLYVGKCMPKERITKNIIDLVIKENLSSNLNWNLIWYFWLRLESMWHSKGQFTNTETTKNDLIMQGIIAMLSYGSSDQGFALISRGFDEMAKGNGEHMLKGLAEHGRWRIRENEIGFVHALDEYLRKIHHDTPLHCTSLILPGTCRAVLDAVACAQCGRLMEKFTMFRRCLD